MKSDCLEFAEVPHSGRLFLDYLAQEAKAMQFYGASLPLAAPVIAASQEHREAMARALERQNRSFGAGAQVIANIARLRGGANAIVTGQQAGLFGGPLLAIWKTLTAIRLAEQYDAVPVFWMATTDHDLAEVDHVSLVRDGELRKVTVALEAVTGAMVSRAEIKSAAAGFAEERGPGQGASLGVVKEMFPQADAEVLARLEGSYCEGERMGIAFAKLWAWLFGRLGLVLIDPDDAELQRLAAPIYGSAAERSVRLNEALLGRDKELDRAGYHEQVKVTRETSLLFVDVAGARTPVRMTRTLRGETTFSAGRLHWGSEREFAGWVKDHAQAVTPNALLRPVVQDCLLPTLAYVGGPAEIAYFAQATALYDELLGGRTPVMMRASATLIEPRVAKTMARYRLSLRELLGMHSEAELAEEMGRRVLPEGVGEAFAASRASVEEQLARLGEEVARTDATLAAAAATSRRKMLYQLGKLEGRAARAQLRKEQQIKRDAAVLWNNLRPHGELQERVIGGIEYVLKYGAAVVEVLSREMKTCAGHEGMEL